MSCYIICYITGYCNSRDMRGRGVMLVRDSNIFDQCSIVPLMKNAVTIIKMKSMICIH